jgi:hypothetical protein
MKAEELKPDSVYSIDDKELAVFKHLGQTGMPIFQPLGEPSFQDCFGLKDLSKHALVFIRKATSSDLGY